MPHRRYDRAHRAPVSRRLAVLAAAALLVVGGVVGAAVDAVVRDGDDDLLARGTQEFTAELSGRGVRVQIDGDQAPEGRIITLTSDSLPEQPAGEFYELWFLVDGGTGDGGGQRRISAGTFHPDEQGRTVVVLHAAVDPRSAGRLEITHETAADGASPSSDVVARGRVDLAR